MLFVITKLDIQNQIVSIVGSYDSYKSALNELFDKIQNQDEQSYVNKINNKRYVKTYKILRGNLYDTKQLCFIYQILDVHNKNNNKKNKN